MIYDKINHIQPTTLYFIYILILHFELVLLFNMSVLSMLSSLNPAIMYRGEAWWKHFFWYGTREFYYIGMRWFINRNSPSVIFVIPGKYYWICISLVKTVHFHANRNQRTSSNVVTRSRYLYELRSAVHNWTTTFKISAS